MFLDIEAAAQYLGVSVRMLRDAVYRRRIAFHRVGRLIRFRVEDLDRFAERVEAEPSAPRRGGGR